MNAKQEIDRGRSDAPALALVGAVIGLVAAVCVVLFEISKGWWDVDGGRDITGWAITVAMFGVILFTEFRLLLTIFRRTGLKLNTRRLESNAPLTWQRYVALFLTAGVVALAGIILFHQAVPILPFNDVVLVAAVGLSGGMLEFIDVKANRAYWLEKLKRANASADAAGGNPRA